MSVPIQVGQADRARRQQALRATLLEALPWLGILDGYLVQGLVGEDEVVLAIAVQIGYRQGNVAADALIRLERAISLAEEGQHIAELVADHKVESAIAVHIRDRQARG